MADDAPDSHVCDCTVTTSPGDTRSLLSVPLQCVENHGGHALALARHVPPTSSPRLDGVPVACPPCHSNKPGCWANNHIILAAHAGESLVRLALCCTAPQFLDKHLPVLPSQFALREGGGGASPEHKEQGEGRNDDQETREVGPIGDKPSC